MRAHEPHPHEPHPHRLHAADAYRPPPGDVSPRVRRALGRAREDARAFELDPRAALAAVAGANALTPAEAAARAERAVAVGDPQAPLARFLEVLDRHDLLDDDGRVPADAHLVSMGDHFDWGHADERAYAAESGYGLLAWLAAQPPARVSILLGNHDLARVGELAPFDDASFREARREALALRAVPPDTPGRAERRRALLARFPTLPSLGAAARDLSTFEARQRALVQALLEAGRMAPAVPVADDLLLVHAPVSARDLPSVGLDARALADGAPAVVLAEAIGARVSAAVAAWDGVRPLSFGALYRPGNAATGESRGVFVQRPADPAQGDPSLFDGPPRRRFDPRELPRGLVQVTGHIRDHKCRDLMPAWCDGEDALDGPLRHLWTDGERVRYRRGLPGAEEWRAGLRARAAYVVFADGGMLHASPGDYEVFDLKRRRAEAPGG